LSRIEPLSLKSSYTEWLSHFMLVTHTGTELM